MLTRWSGSVFLAHNKLFKVIVPLMSSMVSASAVVSVTAVMTAFFQVGSAPSGSSAFSSSSL
jgi:hypothetical protein